jgi:predicted DNA-binding transcriptional regulator AlpA
LIVKIVTSCPAPYPLDNSAKTEPKDYPSVYGIETHQMKYKAYSSGAPAEFPGRIELGKKASNLKNSEIAFWERLKNRSSRKYHFMASHRKRKCLT